MVKLSVVVGTGSSLCFLMIYFMASVLRLTIFWVIILLPVLWKWNKLKGKNFLFIVKKLHGMTSISDDVFEVVRITDDPVVVIDAYHADLRSTSPV